MADRYRAIQRYQVGWTDPRGFYGGPAFSSTRRVRWPKISREKLLEVAGMLIGTVIIMTPLHS